MVGRTSVTLPEAIISIAIIAILATHLVATLAWVDDSARKSDSRKGLEQLGALLDMCANEVPGFFARTHRREVRLASLPTFFPEHVKDSSLLVGSSGSSVESEPRLTSLPSLWYYKHVRQLMLSPLALTLGAWDIFME